MKFQKFSSTLFINLLFISIPLLFIFALRFFDFEGLYGQDSYEYLRYTKAIQEYILGGEHPGSYFWPVLYPFIGALFGFVFRSTDFGLQFLSCISISICFIFILKSIRLLYPKHPFSFLYVLIFGLFCPYFLKMGFIVMSDATSAMFIVICFYFFFKSYLKQTSLTLVFFFATGALMTRYASIIITFPIIVYSLYLIVQRKTYLNFFIGLGLSVIAIIPFLLFQWNALFEATSNYFLKSWSFTYFFKSSYITADGFQSYSLPNGLYALYVMMHPGFIFIGLLLLFLTLKNYKKIFQFSQKILGLSIIVYVIFLAGIPFQNPRILGLVFPLVLLLFYPSFKILLTTRWIKKYAFPFAVFSFILQILFWNKTFQPILQRAILEKEIVSMIEPYQGKTLYSFDVDLSLQSRELNFDFKNLYLERYKNLNIDDLVLFHPKKFERQWEGKNPMLNWNYIVENYELKILKEDLSGWKLYEIQNEK